MVELFYPKLLFSEERALAPRPPDLTKCTGEKERLLAICKLVILI